MLHLTSFLACSLAVVATAGQALQEANVLLLSPEALPVYDELSIRPEKVSARGDRSPQRRTLLAAVSLVIAAAALAFLFLQCYKALNADKSREIYRSNLRRVAEGNEKSCAVSLP